MHVCTFCTYLLKRVTTKYVATYNAGGVQVTITCCPPRTLLIQQTWNQ